jgi:hypothetical protein
MTTSLSFYEFLLGSLTGTYLYDLNKTKRVHLGKPWELYLDKLLQSYDLMNILAELTITYPVIHQELKPGLILNNESNNRFKMDAEKGHAI